MRPALHQPATSAVTSIWQMDRGALHRLLKATVAFLSIMTHSLGSINVRWAMSRAKSATCASWFSPGSWLPASCFHPLELLRRFQHRISFRNRVAQKSDSRRLCGIRMLRPQGLINSGLGGDSGVAHLEKPSHIKATPPFNIRLPIKC